MCCNSAITAACLSVQVTYGSEDCVILGPTVSYDQGEEIVHDRWCHIMRKNWLYFIGAGSASPPNDIKNHETISTVLFGTI